MVHLDKYCSSQLRIDQQPNYSTWRRVHGLQIPLHRLQIIGWLLLAFFIGTTFAVLVPALGPSLRSPALFVLCCLFFLHCVSHFVALAIDPADFELQARERAGIRPKPPDFDRSRHLHVIENGMCHICNIRASSPKTKHCRLCNKCVERFDHHCKWLNQCVGARNYVAFLVCVVSAALASLAVFSVCISELVIYFGNSMFLEALLHNKGLQGADYRVAQLPIPKHYFLAVLVAQALLAFTAATCLLHLCLFHLYISMLGITTYEYIRNDTKGCSAPTTSSSSATTTPTNPGGLASSTTSMPVSLTQSTSSLPLVITFKAYPSGDQDSVANCSRNENASDANLIKQSAGDNHSSIMTLWRQWCCCQKSSFSVLNESHQRNLVPPSKIYANSDTRINVGGLMGGAGSEPALDTFRNEYHDKSMLHSKMVDSKDDCRYSKRGSKSFGARSSMVTNRGVTPKSKIRRQGRQYSALRRLCCGSTNVAKAAADLRSFRSSIGDGISVGSGISGSHADTLNGCRRNQIKPSAVSARFGESSSNSTTAVHRGGRIFIAPRRSNSLNSLPALPPPPRRQIQSVSLKELNEILAYAQRPQAMNGGAGLGASTMGGSLRRPLSTMRRQLRRKSNPQLKPTKTPNLSPIHESGLSNPSTPHLKDRLDRPKELSPLALNPRF